MQDVRMPVIGAVIAALLAPFGGREPAAPMAVVTRPAVQPGAAPEPVLPALRPCGSSLCAGGRRFRWTGVTAFGLADLVADGRSGDARAFVRWAHDTGFNVLRVLTMLPNGGWLDLSPADGRRALPEVFALARAHGMYVQAVALANTNEKSGRYRTDAALREQVRAIARLCAAAGNCVLEIANEPYHASQAALDRPEIMRRLQQEVPRELPVTWGAAADDLSTEMAGGTFVVSHVARPGDRWTRVARARDLAVLARKTGKFVVDNEPIGAAEVPQRDRRDSAPEAFFAQGVLSRLLEVGATFHCEDCLRATVPGPVQRHCADEFIAGRRIVPDEVTVTPVDTDSAATPVVSTPTPERVFIGVSGKRAWVLLLGDATKTPPKYLAGWRPDARLAARPGVEVWRVVR